MNKKIIGVLGCMSPQATANFYKELIKQCRKQYGAEYDKDFPEIFIYNLPVPNMFENVKYPEKILMTLVNGAKKLESIGVDVIVMPCNTVHYFYKEIKKEVSVPILSIAKETAKKLKSMGFKSAGLLATDTTVKSQIYDKDLSELGIELVLPKEQEKVIDIVDNLLTGLKLNRDKDELKLIIKNLRKRKAQAIILGCTDIPLLLKPEDVDSEVFDTAKVLAESTIRFAVRPIMFT